MKIRFADGDKSFDIETEADMVMLYDGDSLQVGKEIVEFSDDESGE